jgi:hypothetical protein
MAHTHNRIKTIYKEWCFSLRLPWWSDLMLRCFSTSSGCVKKKGLVRGQCCFCAGDLRDHLLRERRLFLLALCSPPIFHSRTQVCSDFSFFFQVSILILPSQAACAASDGKAWLGTLHKLAPDALAISFWGDPTPRRRRRKPPPKRKMVMQTKAWLGHRMWAWHNPPPDPQAHHSLQNYLISYHIQDGSRIKMVKFALW